MTAVDCAKPYPVHPGGDDERWRSKAWHDDKPDQRANVRQLGNYIFVTAERLCQRESTVASPGERIYWRARAPLMESG